MVTKIINFIINFHYLANPEKAKIYFSNRKLEKMESPKVVKS